MNEFSFKLLARRKRAHVSPAKFNISVFVLISEIQTSVAGRTKAPGSRLSATRSGFVVVAGLPASTPLRQPQLIGTGFRQSFSNPISLAHRSCPRFVAVEMFCFNCLSNKFLLAEVFLSYYLQWWELEILSGVGGYYASVAT